MHNMLPIQMFIYSCIVYTFCNTLFTLFVFPWLLLFFLIDIKISPNNPIDPITIKNTRNNVIFFFFSPKFYQQKYFYFICVCTNDINKYKCEYQKNIWLLYYLWLGAFPHSFFVYTYIILHNRELRKMCYVWSHETCKLKEKRTLPIIIFSVLKLMLK